MNYPPTTIYVKRDGAGFASRMVSPSGVLMATHDYAATILQSADLVQAMAKERGWAMNGSDPIINVTDGIKDEYIAECNAEKCHKIAIDITECERMLLDLYQNAWQQLPSRPREIIYDACGQMQKFIKELHEEMKATGYAYDDETESAIKIEGEK